MTATKKTPAKKTAEKKTGRPRYMIIGEHCVDGHDPGDIIEIEPLNRAARLLRAGVIERQD